LDLVEGPLLASDLGKIGAGADADKAPVIGDWYVFDVFFDHEVERVDGVVIGTDDGDVGSCDLDQ